VRRSGANGARRGEKSRQCSIGPVRGRLAWLLGLAGVLAFFRRRRPRPQPVLEPAADPAEELRRRLEARREAPGAELPADVPAARPAQDLDERRRQVHDAGRAAVEEMQGEGSER